MFPLDSVKEGARHIQMSKTQSAWVNRVCVWRGETGVGGEPGGGSRTPAAETGGEVRREAFSGGRGV